MISKTTTKASKIALEAINLGKQVKLESGTELTIVQDISFAVARGETLALLGASGSGKSTLLGLLAGLDTPTTGDVHLLGQSLSALNEDERARLRGDEIGFVFQSFQLLSALNALENIMLPLELANRSYPREKALHWLEEVGLSERSLQYPKQLSGGEQQRVAIARALATEPNILLADEPTGNLDAITGAQVSELMFQLNQDLATTLIVVTHDEKLAQMCGRTMHLEAGRIRENNVEIV